jgi:protein-S-isoprenylcysteine O-methyltransferase Ste14
VPPPASPSPALPTPPRTGLSSLAQTVDVETPELVVFSYTIAGVGSRVLAGLLDALICIATLIALLVIGASLRPFPSPGAAPATSSSLDAWATAVTVLAVFFVFWGYYVLFEGLADGLLDALRAPTARPLGSTSTWSSSTASSTRRPTQPCASTRPPG